MNSPGKINKQKIKRVSQVVVNELREEGYARTAEVSIGKKAITIPCYMTKLINPNFVNILCNEKMLNPHMQGIFFNIFEVEEIFRMNRRGRSRQTKIDMTYILDFETLREVLPVFIDPCTEYFYFTTKSKREQFKNIDGIPNFVRTILNESNTESHYTFWRKIMGKGATYAKPINTLINWNIKYQSRFGANVIIPPTPFIDGRMKDGERSFHTDRLLEYAIEVNRKSSFASADVEGKEPSFYFPLNYLVLRDMELLDKITDFLFDFNNEFEQVKITFIKIKHFNPDDEDGRRNLGNFMRALKGMSRETGRCVFLIDADSYAIPLFASGLDGFIEPLNGFLSDFRGKGLGSSRFGQYYHPVRLKFVKFNIIKKIYEKNEKTLPCNCPACQSINGKDIEREIGDYSWNLKRREHLLYKRADLIKMIRDAIRDTEMRGISDLIQNSAYKNYIEMLPNPFI